VSIYAYSRKHHIEPTPIEDMPSAKDVYKDPCGLTFFLGVGTLVTALLMGYSAMFSVILASVAMIIISLFSQYRLNVKKSIEVLNDTSEDFLMIGVGGGSIGIFISILLLSGLVLRFSNLVIGMVGGNVLLLLVLTA